MSNDLTVHPEPRRVIIKQLAAMNRWKKDAAALENNRVRLHLAVFTEPYASLILSGDKTVESRFSCVKCAPYDRVSHGDLVLIKESGGPVIGIFKVGGVWYYEIDDSSWGEIRERFAEAICPQGSSFWSDRSSAQYATLMKVQKPDRLKPVTWPKRDRRGWVVIPNTSQGLFE